jgi:Short C-terminal domain
MSLSAEQVNEQALTVATEVVNDSVVAACHMEQVTQGQQMKAAGIGGATRGMAKFGTKLGEGLMPGVGGMAKGLRGAGLPENFVLAVTSGQVHAIEEKDKKGKLVKGKVLKSWDRDQVSASMNAAQVMGAMSGTPEDRQVITLYLPLDGSKNKYLAASAQMQAQAGGSGQPTKFQIAKDEASEAVAKELIGDAPAMPNVQIGGVPIQQMGQMPGQPAAGGGDSTAQLEKLAQLHASGALTDEEFAAQKAKIIST